MNNLREDILAAGALIMLGCTITLLFFVDFPDSSKDVLLVVIGVLTTIVKDVYSFSFSTSKSGEKTAQAVLKMAEGAAPAAVAAAAVTTAATLAASDQTKGITQ